MSDLNANFTFRLTEEDKAALTGLAMRMRCDRGEALRRLIRSSHQIVPGESGHFVAHGQTLRLKLHVSEQNDDE
jgi:hypothetical protein